MWLDVCGLKVTTLFCNMNIGISEPHDLGYQSLGSTCSTTVFRSCLSTRTTWWSFCVSRTTVWTVPKGDTLQHWLLQLSKVSLCTPQANDAGQMSPGSCRLTSQANITSAVLITMLSACRLHPLVTCVTPITSAGCLLCISQAQACGTARSFLAPCMQCCLLATPLLTCGATPTS